MSILIGKLEFEGPYVEQENIREEPGLFGIICEVDGEMELIELDETDCLRHCLTADEYVNNIHFYNETCRGRLSAAVHYTTDLTSKERRELVNGLMSELEDKSAES